MTLPPYNPPPPIKEGRGPLAWIAIGCGGCFTALIAFVIVIYLIVVAAMRQSTPVEDALAQAKADPRVVAALGEPIETGWFFMGNLKTDNRDGSADIRVNISGPKAKAKLHVVGTKKDGTWTYEEMTVRPAGGMVIDLLKK
jgi:hypothetical protein